MDGETPDKTESALLDLEENIKSQQKQSNKDSKTYEAALVNDEDHCRLEVLEPLLFATGNKEAETLKQVRRLAMESFNQKWSEFANSLVFHFVNKIEEIQRMQVTTLDELRSAKDDIIKNIKE